MKYKSLFESLDSNVGSKIIVRRYNLSSMISESYKALYECEKNTNFYKLVEAHLNDVRNHPSDTDRLSRQLSIIKEISKLMESGEIKDSDLLVPKKSHDTVDPKKERALDLSESKDDEDVEEHDDENLLDESKDDESVEEKDDENLLDESAHDEDVEETEDEDLLEDTDLTDEEVEELTRHLSEIRKAKKVPECSKPSAKPHRIKKVDEAAEDSYSWDTEWRKIYGDICRTKYYQKDGSDIIGTIYEPDGKEFTEYGADIYDNQKADVLAGTGYDADADGFSSEEEAKRWVEAWFSKNLTECSENVSTKGRKIKRSNESTKGRKLKRSTTECSKTPVRESKSSYDSLNLASFNKKSSNKAFLKTFKKLESKLKEGTALTRQESISLYKAANSAMTHLSVELEHNPEFLSTFKESVTLLSKDVNKILDGLKENKAPSKATMKSLAKFAEALLKEDRVLYPNGAEVDEDSPDMDRALDYMYGEDRKSKSSDYSTEQKQKAINYWLEKTDGKLKEAEDEEDLPPIEDEEDEFVGADEGDISSEELEDYFQDYADGRVDLHVDMRDKHEDSEDPDVQDQLAQDAEEVVNIPGITDEQVDEITGDETSEEDEETPEDETPEEEDDSEITDDELAELKRHLTEMRKAKKAK